MIYKLISHLMARFKDFTVFDIAVFKSLLLIFGILFGASFSKGVKKIAPLLWLSIIPSYLWLIFKMFGKEKDSVIQEF